MMRSKCLFLTLALAGITAPAAAQDTRTLISEPYEVSDARAAMDEIMARDDLADQKDQEALMSGEVSASDFVPSQPIFQAISWPDDTCVDLVSLFPSPPEGWAIYSDWGRYENPIGAERGELFYVSIPDVPLGDPAFVSQQQSVTVRVTANSQHAQLWDMRMENPQMREIGFDEGPFGYPIMKFQNATMLGDFHVDVSGTGDENAPKFLEKIIGCAIDSGLLANGVDPETLTR